MYSRQLCIVRPGRKMVSFLRPPECTCTPAAGAPRRVYRLLERFSPPVIQPLAHATHFAFTLLGLGSRACGMKLDA